jgi:hypothetical protein
MQIAIITGVARQVEGEFVFINVIKAHTDPNVLRQYLNQTDLPRTQRLNDVDCVVEYGVIEGIEVEGVTVDSSDQR